MAIKAHYGPKIEIFNFELEIKLDHHFYVEFRGESYGGGLEAQKPSLGPQNGHKGPLGVQKSKF